MNTNKFKLYFEKLDIDPSIISLDLLKKIQRKHLENFSFNNISVLLKQDISLDIDDIIDKIIVNNLGGYCFEHNKLIHDVLESLGFNVRILIARVINNQDIDTPRTHRITLLEFDNEQYIVDVGFGAMCPKIPIKINSNYTENTNITLEFYKDNKKVYTLNDLHLSNGILNFGHINIEAE